MQKGRVSFVTGNGSCAPLQRPTYACFWSRVVHCWAMIVAFEPFVQYFPPSSARSNQECDFHFATMCFSLCVLGEYQQSLEYLQFSLIRHLWNMRVSVAFVWHVLNAQCLHHIRQSLSCQGLSTSAAAAVISLHTEGFPSLLVSVPTASCRGCLKWSWYKHDLPGESFPLEALMTFGAWGPGLRQEDFVAVFQVSIPLKALHPGRNILRGERLQDSSPYVVQRRFV